MRYGEGRRGVVLFLQKKSWDVIFCRTRPATKRLTLS